MKKLLSGLCALGLITGVMAGCTDTSRERVGENPSDRSPSASPPTAPSDMSSGRPGTSTAPTPPPANTPGSSSTDTTTPKTR